MNLSGVFFPLPFSLWISWYADKLSTFFLATPEQQSTFGSPSSKIAVVAEIWSKAYSVTSLLVDVLLEAQANC